MNMAYNMVDEMKRRVKSPMKKGKAMGMDTKKKEEMEEMRKHAKMMK